ncbi:hypothetical protein DFH09DRAFT_1305748 [Mycena vulgaris]|nr:hypothetical protein DFH09DRAFT_1305748 [Mycena vulgaris]
MDAIFRCRVPFYADPGQPDGPQVGQKIYLVTGRNVGAPGVYVSWPSADAQYKSVPGATLKGYKTWEPLVAAWDGGCDRGEHAHPAACDADSSSDAGDVAASAGLTALRPVAASSSPHRRTASASPKSSPSRHAQPLFPSAVKPAVGPTCSPRHLSSTHSAPLPSSAAAIPGRMSYAVKHSAAEGAVFADYEAARAVYHRLQAEGKDPLLAAGPSLTEAVCFLEGFSLANGSTEASRRWRWSEEERAARVHHVGAMWGDAVETWQLGHRDVWISSSDNDSSNFDEESSVSTE